MSHQRARKKFVELVERTELISDAELDEYWASLRPATIDGMLGEWRGHGFNTDHKLNAALKEARWFGKTFNSAADVKPLVCLDADGTKYSNVELGKGEATLWLEEFRGEITATMVYDGQPSHDHFKRIDANTVMGIMNGKFALNGGRLYYFYLERV